MPDTVTDRWSSNMSQFMDARIEITWNSGRDEPARPPVEAAGSKCGDAGNGDDHRDNFVDNIPAR